MINRKQVGQYRTTAGGVVLVIPNYCVRIQRSCQPGEGSGKLPGCFRRLPASGNNITVK